MKTGFIGTTVERLLAWSRSQSLHYYSVGGGCCADEVLTAEGCRYDLERFGAVAEVDPAKADVLLVTGAVSYRALPHLRALYEEMAQPRYVIAIGSCASCGGAFSPETSYSVLPGLALGVPVDVFVPGCPPRPEAVMNGLIALQDKINGHGRTRQ